MDEVAREVRSSSVSGAPDCIRCPCSRIGLSQMSVAVSVVRIKDTCERLQMVGGDKLQSTSFGRSVLLELAYE